MIEELVQKVFRAGACAAWRGARQYSDALDENAAGEFGIARAEARTV